MAELSPMMKQYLAIKEQNKDTIVFFRLGDFYEMFFEDAKLASKELDLTLTGKDCGMEERAPMCGVPFHSAESYIAKLVSKGYKVGICEQLEDPATSKGIVKRDIIRVITPGTVLEASMLDESNNNYIASIVSNNLEVGVSFCDISTGQLYVTEFKDNEKCSKLIEQLISFNPKEILLGGYLINDNKLLSFVSEKLEVPVVKISNDDLGLLDLEDVVKKQFGEKTFNSITSHKNVISSLGVLLNYLVQTQKTGLQRINNIEIYSDEQFMTIDYNTRRNLELTQNLVTKEKKHSLLWVLDRTKTAMGKRLIKSWIEQPLMNVSQIVKRQNAVDELVNDTVKRLDLSALLVGIFDIERLMTKIVYGNANARELRSLSSAIVNLPKLKKELQGFNSKYLKEIYDNIDELTDIFELIDNSIVEEPPFSVREGGMIKKGYNEQLDLVNSDMNDSTSILARIENEQKELTGIPKLKVGYNRVFGYYIEVSNSYKSLVPDFYIRKQTLSNCERYITQELKELEGRILGAKDKSVALEYQIFSDIRNSVSNELDRIETTARYIAVLDVLLSLANVASDNRYTKPEISYSSTIILKDSRHPVVEMLLKDTPFVPNDVILDDNKNRAAIITGPNMAGKSTYMRQVALVTLMAQIGSFVPASYAEIGVVDSIFTRVGASDDLASGQSTFMVEMNEVAHIVKSATSRSLIILDEIGRGTSTYDGMAIARAVLEYVADKKKLGAKTMFATHYHELTVMEELIDGVKNYNIACKKRGDDITFLRRIVRGGADDSYGIEVAKLAGVPDSIIKRSKQILSELIADQNGFNTKDALSNIKDDYIDDELQLSLIPSDDNKISDKLKNIDVNTLTPIEAMNLLYELKSLIDE